VWLRSQRATAVDLGEDVVLVGRDGTVRRLEGPTGELARAVLALLARPHAADDIVAHVEALAGTSVDRRVIDELIALLAESGAIAEAREPERAAVTANIVVGVSGAIAATHAPALVAALQRRGHAVEVALTPTATRFVAIDALRAIVQREPHGSLWPHAAHAPVPHVALAQWADVVVIYPASATTIGRIANGDFSELVAAIAGTARAVAIVPSMNVAMFESPAVARNLDRLRADGFAIVHGVPSVEAADAPAARRELAHAAPAAGEVAHAIDALLAVGALPRRASWDTAYRSAELPWVAEPDADLVAALDAHAPPPGRLLELGCGLGQLARHAAARGHRVVATDLSDVALAHARRVGGDVIWLRDDVRASALAGPFEVIIDRAVLHTLPAAHAGAWGATVRRLGDGIVIVKAHRHATTSTTGWTAAKIATLLPDFALVEERDTTLPGPTDPTPIPAILVVLQRRR
jgi:SAM-dependent methyltransferase